MLVIRLELDKTKENYRAVMEALADFDIASASWETVDSEVKAGAKSGRTGDSLSSAVSAAIDALGNRRPRG